jgi:hypothetical protein
LFTHPADSSRREAYPGGVIAGALCAPRQSRRCRPSTRRTRGQRALNSRHLVRRAPGRPKAAAHQGAARVQAPAAGAARRGAPRRTAAPAGSGARACAAAPAPRPRRRASGRGPAPVAQVRGGRRLWRAAARTSAARRCADRPQPAPAYARRAEQCVRHAAGHRCALFDGTPRSWRSRIAR